MSDSTPESPPGYIVRTEVQQAAWNNGFRVERGVEGPWLAYASTTAPGNVWIAGIPPRGPWFLSVDHPGVAAELRPLPLSQVRGPGRISFILATLSELHTALGRAYRLALSLPDAPLERFRGATVGIPRSTEAERLVIQRVGQGIFREALLAYWGGRCPLTGITDAALLRASHIVPWAESDDEARLDVHNGLLLAAHWDAAFDGYLVSFSDDGEPEVSRVLSARAQEILRIQQRPRIEGLTKLHMQYLTAHRTRFAELERERH